MDSKRCAIKHRSLGRAGHIGTVALILALFVALTPQEAQADTEEPHWSAASGVQFDYAPMRNHVGFFTRFLGTSEEFRSLGEGSGDLDWWAGDLTLFAEVEIPTTPVSFYGDITYRFIASGDNARTGWSDATLGGKVSFLEEDVFILSAFLYGNLPIGADSVNWLNYSATNLGVGFSVMPTSFFALNTNVALGRLWDLEWPDGNNTNSWEFSFLVETVLIMPFVELASARLGFRGSYRENAWDKDAFFLYGQVNVLLAFLRVGVPIAVERGLDGVQQGIETGELTVTLGLNVEF